MPAKLPIVKRPDRILRKKAAEIAVADISSAAIQKLIADMKETLKQTPDGVGLAAPQIGESLRIFIVSDEAEEIDRAGGRRREGELLPPHAMEEKPKKLYEEREWKYHVFINPKVKNMSRKKWDAPEGCLSVPGTFGVVPRHEKITVEAYNEHGKKFTRGASRFVARVIQHELDHLEGKLFIDRVKKNIK